MSGEQNMYDFGPDNMDFLHDVSCLFMEHLDELPSMNSATTAASTQHDEFCQNVLDLGDSHDPTNLTKLASQLIRDQHANANITYSPSHPRKRSKTFCPSDFPNPGNIEEEVVTSGSVPNTPQNAMNAFSGVNGSSPKQAHAKAELVDSNGISVDMFGDYQNFYPSTPPLYNSSGYAVRRPPARVRQPSINMSSSMPRMDPTMPLLDANYAKLQLQELGYPYNKKDPKIFCHQVVHWICNYLNIRVGGFYINNNNSMNPQNAWLLSSTYPTQDQFNQYFHYHVGERFIMQAAVEKRCFCVHSSSWENNSALLSFLFVPIPNDQASAGNPVSFVDNAPTTAVMVLGTVLTREEELHSHLLFLDNVRKTIASILRTLLHIQHNLYLLQKIDVTSENDIRNQSSLFERTVVAVLTSLNKYEEDLVIIATNPKGLITYMSAQAQKLLGYLPEELCGRFNVAQIHDMNDLSLRCKEIEQESGGKIIPADFNAIIYKTVFGRGADETRIWQWYKKDRSSVSLKLTVRPLNDDQGVVGFVLFGKDERN